MPDPSRVIQHVDYNYTGGLNVDASPDHLDRSELQIAENVELSKRGGLRKRKSSQVLFEEGFYEKITQVFEWQRDDGTSSLLFVADQTLMEYIFETEESEPLHAVGYDRIAYFFLQDKLYFIGEEQMYVYDGDTVEEVTLFYDRHTLPAPPEAPVVEFQTIIGGGAFSSGTYKCLYVYVTKEGEIISQASPVAEVEAPPDSYRVDWIMPNPNYQRVLPFMTLADGEEFYQLFHDVIPHPDYDTITDPIEHKFYNEPDIEEPFVDTDPDEQFEYEEHPVETCKFAVRHPKSFRMFYAGAEGNESALYFSEPNDPPAIRETSVLYPTTADGPVTGLAVFMDAVLVFYKNSIWSWRGIDPEIDAVWEKLPTSEGTLSSNTIHLTTSSITMFGPGGLYALSPNIIGVSMAMEARENYINNIAKNRVSSIIKEITYPEQATGVFDSKHERYLLSYCDDDTGINNNVLVFDFNLGSFTLYPDIHINDFCYTLNGDILAASDNNMIVFEQGLDSEGDPEYDPARWKIRSPRYHFGHPFRKKKVSRIYVAMENPFIDGYKIIVTLYADDEEVESKEVVIGSGGARLYTARLQTYAVGSRFEVVIEEHEDSPVPVTGMHNMPTLYGIALDYNLVQQMGDTV